MITDLDTPAGPARLHLAAAERPRAVLLLGHGANGGVDAPELAGLAARLPGAGITVVRFEQPWAVTGRGMIAPVAQLDAAWRAGLAALAGGPPLFVGGRSNGARVACRSFAAGQLGLVLSAFPLHPPGRPEASRLDELSPVAASALLLQTEGDPFGGADELVGALAAGGATPFRLVRIPGRTHGPDARSKAGRERLDALLDLIAVEVIEFVDARLRDGDPSASGTADPRRGTGRV